MPVEPTQPEEPHRGRGVAFAARALLSLLFWIYFATTCVFFFLGALVIWLVTLPFDRHGRLLHLYSCFWAASYFYINPLWSFRMAPGSRAPERNRAYVIVSNHQSLGDILALFATYLPYKWVSKASVFRVPFLGWNMRLNRYVPITRGNQSSIEKMSAACKDWLSRGVSVALFPEGTRSEDCTVKPFKVGAFRIAREAGVPILPVVLNGTADSLPKHGFVIQRSTHARVCVLAPHDVSPYPTDEAAAEAVRMIIAEQLARMRAEPMQ